MNNFSDREKAVLCKYRDYFYGPSTEATGDVDMNGPSNEDGDAEMNDPISEDEDDEIIA